MDAVPEATVDLEITRPPWGEIGRVATLVVVSGFSKLILNVLNSTKVLNRDQLLEAVEGREPGVGLLTVANHTRYGISGDPLSCGFSGRTELVALTCKHCALC